MSLFFRLPDLLPSTLTMPPNDLPSWMHEVIAQTKGDSRRVLLESVLGFTITDFGDEDTEDARPSQEARANASRAAEWYGADEPVVVAGRTLRRVYVADDLPPRSYRDEHKSLIVRSLEVTDSSGKRPPFLNFWSGYRDAGSRQRGAYLDWLAGGAQTPVDSYYALLYFYGLERRFFHDTPSSAERADLIAEVRRLRGIMATDHSFRYRADAFLAAAAAFSPERHYLTEPEIELRSQPTHGLLIALGQAALDKAPLSADWMLAWLYQDERVSKSMAAKRCVDEVRVLFGQRYRTQFGEGLILKPGKKRLSTLYHAASGDFTKVAADHGVPDVSRLRKPLSDALPLFDKSVAELDAYSRWLARNPADRDSAQALALLPLDLSRQRLADSFDPFLKWVRDAVDGETMAQVDAVDLGTRWLGATGTLNKSGALPKRQAELLSELLGRMDIGIEPDVRWGGKAVQEGQYAVLFRATDTDVRQPSTAFRVAHVALVLMAAAAHSGGDASDAQRAHALAFCQSQDLPAYESERLSARAVFLLGHPPTLRDVRSAAKSLPILTRQELSHHALQTASLDGPLTPEASRTIGKLYEALSLPAAALYSDLHALQTGADAPTLVRPRGDASPGFALPQRPSDAPAPTFTLDLDAVRAKLADTHRASALLAGVFADEEEAETATPTTEPEALPGLDARHSALALLLVEQSEWSRDTYEALASEYGLMSGGALEAINEWAFDALGDALIEDDDPLVVDLDAWRAYQSAD